MICSRRRATKRMRLRSEDRSLSIDPMHFFPQRSLALCCWVHTRNTTTPHHTTAPSKKTTMELRPSLSQGARAAHKSTIATDFGVPFDSSHWPRIESIEPLWERVMRPRAGGIIIPARFSSINQAIKQAINCNSGSVIMDQ